MVGISGAMDERRAVVTPRPRSFADLTCAIAALVEGKPTDTSPLRRAVMAWGVLRYVTDTIWVPVMLWNSADVIMIPAPETPTLICPGRALASATSCFTVLAGTEGCTARRNDPIASIVTGVKSLTKS